MKNTKGFTLVELMVVIAIIAILAVGSITGYSAYIKKARDNTRVTELRAAENALTAYTVDNTEAPADLAAVTAALESVNGGLPSDPSGNASFYYFRCTDDTSNFITAVVLESENVGAASTDRDTTTTQVLELGTVNAISTDCGGYPGVIDPVAVEATNVTAGWVSLN